MNYVKKILNDFNFTIKYDYFGDNKAQITTPDKQEIYVEFKNDTLIIESNIKTTEIKCSINSVRSILNLYLRSICKYYEYDYEYINYFLDGKPSTHFFFGKTKEKKKENKIYELYDIMVRGGLFPDLISEIKNNKVEDDFKFVIEQYLGIQINAFK